MQNAGYAALQIIPSFKGFESKLDAGTRGAMGSAGTKGGTAYGDAAGKSAGSRFRTVFASAAKLGMVGALAAGALAIKLGKDSIAEAREAQKVGALTASTIKATGSAAKVTAKQVGDLAEAISLKTGIDDEVIQSGQNMLLTFKNIRNEAGKGNDIFNQSTEALIDMASAMGTEPKQAAIQLGKALNDPVKGISALSRVGIQFTEEQTKQIEAMVKSGKTMEAQKVILGELKSQFGGAAAAQATMGEKVSVAWGNLQEKLGTALLPLLDDLQRYLLKKGIPAMETFVEWFADKGVDGIKNFGAFMRDEVFPVLKDVGEFAKDAGEFVGEMVKKFNDLPDAGKLAALGAVVGGGVALKVRGGGGGALGAAGSALGLAKPVPVFVTNPGFGGAGGPGGAAGGGITKGGALKLAGASILVGAGAEVLFGDSFGLRGQSQYEQQREGQGFGRLGAPRVLDAPNFDANFGGFIDKAQSAVSDVTKAFSTLPKELRTEFATEGVPQTLKETQNVLSRYDLTPKEKRTVFAALGSDQAKAQAKALITQYGATPKQKSTLFELTGYTTLMSQIRSINTSMDLASRDRRIAVTVAYSNAGYQTRGGLQKANGGAIYGPGTGSSDDIPAWLSNGEHVWTAREVQNAGGHAAMEQLRRRFRYANGGAVGSSTPNVNVNAGATNVTVLLDGREIRHTVRAEMASADTFKRRLEDR